MFYLFHFFVFFYHIRVTLFVLKLLEEQFSPLWRVDMDIFYCVGAVSRVEGCSFISVMKAHLLSCMWCNICFYSEKCKANLLSSEMFSVGLFFEVAENGVHLWI